MKEIIKKIIYILTGLGTLLSILFLYIHKSKEDTIVFNPERKRDNEKADSLRNALNDLDSD